MIQYDKAAGQFVCDFVERLPTTDTGKPFRLYRWQRETLMEFYSTMELDSESERWLRRYQYLYLEIPKKNGKSELSAALGIYHLFGDGELNAEVYICAADKENAGIVFRAAVFMLETAPWTAKMIARGELKIIRSQKKIEYRRQVKAENGGLRWVSVGLMQVLSSESYSKHGYKPSCVIFDELHAQPDRKLWDVMTGAAGAAHTQPVWLVLTTAGDDPDRGSIGWEIHEKAVAIRDARRLSALGLDELKRMGVVLKRAQYFITCRGFAGAHPGRGSAGRERITRALIDPNVFSGSCEQLSLFSPPAVDNLIGQGVPPRAAVRMVREEAVQCLAKAL